MPSRTKHVDGDKVGRGTRRVVTGIVTSNKMDKTVTVTVVRKFRDRHFHKFIKRRVKYHARDAQNDCNIGDKVELVESRPYSKTVRWRVSRTLERSREVS